MSAPVSVPEQSGNGAGRGEGRAWRGRSPSSGRLPSSPGGGAALATARGCCSLLGLFFKPYRACRLCSPSGCPAPSARCPLSGGADAIVAIAPCAILAGHLLSPVCRFSPGCPRKALLLPAIYAICWKAIKSSKL